MTLWRAVTATPGAVRRSAFDGRPVGLDWPLVMALAEDMGLPRATVTELLPAVEAGLLIGPDEEGDDAGGR